MSTASDWLNETVLYGGTPVRRADMEGHLGRLEVTGPAQLVYARLPAVDLEPRRLDEVDHTENGEDR